MVFLLFRFSNHDSLPLCEGNGAFTYQPLQYPIVRPTNLRPLLIHATVIARAKRTDPGRDTMSFKIVKNKNKNTQFSCNFGRNKKPTNIVILIVPRTQYKIGEVTMGEPKFRTNLSFQHDGTFAGQD